MKIAHFIEIRVFSYEEDNEEQIVEKIKELIPFDFNKEKIELKKKNAFGFNDKIISVICVGIKKQNHTSKVIEKLLKKLNNDQKKLLLKQLQSRLDKDLHFFIRLDKDKLLKNEYWITDSGNCFHFKIAIAAYPHKREVGEKIVEELLKFSISEDE